MAKDKKTVTNAMRLLNASKIKYETVEYEADEVGEHFGEAIAEDQVFRLKNHLKLLSQEVTKRV